MSDDNEDMTEMREDHARWREEDAFELTRKLRTRIVPAPIVTLPTWPVTVCSVSQRTGEVIITRRDISACYTRDWS